MISFRQRLDLSWMGKGGYYPPLWWRRWGKKGFLGLWLIGCFSLGRWLGS